MASNRGEPWLADADVTLYAGDVLAVLPELPAESVDCVVTSPPYWGLRDYGTGAWDGGDAECDHQGSAQPQARDELPPSLIDRPSPTGGALFTKSRANPSRECVKCGATRIDQQLGLEPTPEQYVERMVQVFREVRRVLASHGTVWCNLGDSFQDKQLAGVPWKVAFALQADGWYLRSDIIWAKPNPMPESVTDRPTKAHEYVFLLSKQPRYFFDAEAVRERNADPEWTRNALENPSWLRRSDSKSDQSRQDGDRMANGRPHTFATQTGRNIRSVWEIATQPFSGAHFATFPEELCRRAIAAGCPEQVCRVCGKARERVVEASGGTIGTGAWNEPKDDPHVHEKRGGHKEWNDYRRESKGFTDCGCAFGPSPKRLEQTRALRVGEMPTTKYRPGVTLDPFVGSGTVAYVARKLGRHAVGIDLNQSYLELAARRLQQQSLFAMETDL